MASARILRNSLDLRVMHTYNYEVLMQSHINLRPAATGDRTWAGCPSWLVLAGSHLTCGDGGRQ